MKKTLCSDKYEEAKGFYKGSLWKTWGDFAKDHDLVLANWITSNPVFEGMEYYFTPDDEDVKDYGEDYFPEIFQYYLTDRNTIEDIKNCNIYTPYFEHCEDDIYVVGITHFGTGWDYVSMLYLLDDTDDEENEGA